MTYRVLTVAAMASAAAILATGSGRAANEEFDRLEATYRQEIERIHKAREDSLARRQQALIDALAALEQKLQGEGNLEGLLRVRKERERFEEERVLTDAHVAADLTPLGELQVGYLQDLEQMPIEEAQQVLRLAQQYDHHLAKLQADLTRQDRLEEAILIKKERESLEMRPEVSAARFTLADAEARAPRPSPAAPEPEPTEPPAGHGPPGAAEEPDIATDPKKVGVPVAGAPKYKGSTKNYIKRRFEDLTEEVLDQDWDAAMEYLDPRFVASRGRQTAEARLRMAFFFLAPTQDRRVELRVDEVRVDDDDLRASVIPQIVVNNQRRTLQGIDWLQVDGDWFVDMPLGELPRAEQKRPVPVPRKVAPKSGWRR
jgi:hypothetical protein